MATKEELKKIAVKSIEDDDFRAAFEEDPEKAASSLGITLTAEQAANIKKSKAKAEAAGVRESKGFLGSIVSSF